LTEEDVLRMGLAVLEGMRDGVRMEDGAGRPGMGDLSILRQVERRLANEAAAHPGKFLEGYEGIKKLKDIADVVAVEKAIGLLLPVAEELPGRRRDAADGGLSGLYFRAVK
jgi:hypothetical protein